jgi:HD-GYP domain-containing protein (c-di-GMP phosphodiesterase class II)
VFTSLPSGASLSRSARLVHLVHVAQVHYQVGGTEAADAVVRARSGTEFDPQLAKLWLEHSRELVRPLTGDSVWEQALAAEPAPHRLVRPSHLDDVTAAFADFVDLKSPYTLGHSSRVADLAERGGAAAGLNQQEVATLRRAGQVHDLGNVSVPNRVWTKPGSLSRAEWERVRLHAYHSHRVLSVTEPLRPAAELASLHHERLDGSGYHRGLPAPAIPASARVLAAAEVYQAMTEARSWRPALTRAEAARDVREEAKAGRLEPRAVDAVLEAAGEHAESSRGGRGWPSGLTDREVEVLRLLARGRSNKEIARQLHVSDSTVHTHVINVYGKIAVNTRAGAALFAIEHDLIQL